MVPPLTSFGRGIGTSLGPPPANVYNIPGTVDGTGATDTTLAIQTWVNSVPDGTLGNPNTLRFGAGAIYGYAQGSWGEGFQHVDESPSGASNGSYGAYLLIRRNHLILDFNGCTFQALEAGTQHRFTWFAAGGSGVTFKNGTIDGRAGILGPPTGDPEFQSPIWLEATDSTTIRNMTLKHCTGYFIEFLINSIGRATPSNIPSATPCSNVLVDGCTFDTQQNSNAQGLAIEGVNGLTIQNCTMLNPAANGIDVEPNFTSWPVQNITINNNTITGVQIGGGGCIVAVASGMDGNLAGNWTITNNTLAISPSLMPPGASNIYGIWISPAVHNLNGLTITGNNITCSLYPFFMSHITNLDIENNTTTQPTGSPNIVLAADNCTGKAINNMASGISGGQGAHDRTTNSWPGTNSITTSGNTGWPPNG